MSLLQEKRLAKGLSVQETAQALGVSTDDVRRWEAGELPDAKVLLPLSDLFGVAVEDILRGSEGARATMPECGAFSAEEGEELSEEGAANGPPPAENRPIDLSRSGSNGFSRGERIFGFILCAAFVLAVAVTLFAQFFAWVGRERALTSENYAQYLEIDSRYTENFNPDEVEVVAVARTEIYDLRVELSFSVRLYDGETEVHSVVLTAESLQEGESCSATVQLGMMAAGFPRIGSVMVEGRLP